MFRAGLLIALGSLTALVAACGQPQACTMARCQDNTWLALDAEPQGAWYAEVEILPLGVTYAGTCPRASDETGVLEPTSGDADQLPLIYCTGDGISVGGAVEQIRYYAEVDGVTYGPRPAEVVNAFLVQPNGPDCGGQCKQQIVDMASGQ